MNPLLEMEEETPVEVAEEVVHVPEVLTEEEVQAIKTPTELLQQLEACKTRFASLRPTDSLTVKQCVALIQTCAFASRYAESQRTEITEPLNKQVKETNAIWMPIRDGFAEVAKSRGVEVAKFIDDQRKEAARLQQKAIDDAKARQDELDRKADEERQEAERLRLQAEQASTPEEKIQLEKQADKLESKAEIHELKSSQVVTEVVPAQAKTIDTGSATFSAKAPKKTWLLASWDKQKPLRLTDPALKSLVGDLSKLPPGVQFLLRYSDLNPVHLNKAFGEVEFPEPFASVDDFKGSSVRGK